MWKFSERFMEDCIHANPSVFLSENVEIIARQKRIRGFIPDLIVKNERGETLIVEIQQNALDRYHLYKSLEYRDLALEQDPGSVLRVILFCETMDERFRQLIKTHSIELIVMERKCFLAIAIRETPDVVSAHLLNEASEAPVKKQPEEIRLEFKPLDWGPRKAPSDVLAHLYGEFGRLGIDIDKVPREYYRQIYWDVCNLLDEDFQHALQELWLPDAWNYDALLVDAKRYDAPDQKALKRPRISISPHITQKGNLSVVWWPTDYHRGNSICDWNWWPGDHSVGWSRPNNELFFIREVKHLNPGLHFSQWDDRVNYDVLDGIFIGLLKCALSHFLDICRIFFDVELINDIELDLSGPEAVPGNMFPERVIVGWRFYNVEERRRRNEDEWIANFEKSFGFTIDQFSRSYRTASFSSDGRVASSVMKKVANELKKSGYKITEGGVQSILQKLSSHHSSDIRAWVK